MKRLLALAILSLAACGENRPPTPTAEQSDQLNEVETMLNAEAANEEGPAPEGTGPSNRSD